MRTWVWVLVAAGTLVLLACVLTLFCLVSRPLAIPDEGAYYDLKRGASMGAMLDDFYRQGWLSHKTPLHVWARLRGVEKKLQAGEYRLEPGLNAREALNLLTAGQTELRQLTFIEGWTTRQVLDQLRASGLRIDWRSDDELREILGLADYRNVEGWIFPDTYYYRRGMRASEVLKLAHDHMKTALEEEWEHRQLGLPYRSAYEALIIASIVEKEARLKEEQPRIAGVLVRRLQQRIALAADPTVIYGLGSDFNGNLTRRHLRDRKNPYNTYLHKGLPPTPIATVSRSALRASLHPSSESALYFVARGDGSHVFSDTLEEHEYWVEQYQLR